jgi:hypothetical protein
MSYRIYLYRHYHVEQCTLPCMPKYKLHIFTKTDAFKIRAWLIVVHKEYALIRPRFESVSPISGVLMEMHHPNFLVF